MQPTEDELTKALAGDREEEKNSILTDLESEFKEEEKQEPEKTEEPEPAEPSTEEEPKDETQPEESKQEEEAAEEPVIEESAPETEPEMILGKFKTQDDLVKAYQNLEKRLTEKAKEVKEVEKVNSDDFDKAVNQKIAEENWKLVEKAFDTITDKEHYKEAQFLLSQFKKTGDGQYLEQARGYLDARIDRRLEVESMNVAAKIYQTANAHRQEILLKPLSDELDKMAEEDPDFMNDTQNQDLMAMAIKLNPTIVDVRAVKKAIQEYRNSSYQKGYEAAKKEFAKQAEKKVVPIKSTARIEQPKPQKTVGSMSIKEQLEEEMKSML